MIPGQRQAMMQEAGRRCGDLLYMLGGRAWQGRPNETNVDGEKTQWKPNIAVVRAVVRFARDTGRLDAGRLDTGRLNT